MLLQLVAMWMTMLLGASFLIKVNINQNTCLDTLDSQVLHSPYDTVLSHRTIEV